LFKTAVAAIAPRIEDHGIDEIYIDLTDQSIGTAAIARRIKQAVQEATGLSCSIGVAPNKLLSKICSDLEKPDGLTVLDPTEIATRIWPLPVKKVNGIGPIAARKLDALGISTIGQLACADPGFLQLSFGSSYGRWLYEVSHGMDDRPVIINPEPRSLSRETTFERDLHPRHDRSFLSGIFTGLCVDLAKDLQRKGYVARTIGIKLRFEDFKTVTRASTLIAPTADAMIIRRAAEKCLQRVSLNRKLRLLGVRASALSPGSLSRDTAVFRQKELPLVNG
jgi:DNA polymerase-4